MKYLISLATIMSAMLGVVSLANAESLTVECTSQTQMCNQVATYNFTSEGPPTFYQLNLKTPTSHCSAVKYYVMTESRVLSTPFLQPGQSYPLNLGKSIPRGNQTVLIGAVGRVGGCNTGFVQSWGVDVNAAIVPQ